MADLSDVIGPAAGGAAPALRGSHRAWALPGGSHDRLIGILKMVLPVSVGLLTAFLAVAPFSQSSEVSFVLDKNKVDVAKERLKVVQAVYRGEDSQGRPFSLRAGSALQKSSRERVVQLNDLEARLKLKDDSAVMTARQGHYDMANEKVGIDGPVQFQSSNGYRFTTRDVDVDLTSRKLQSRSEVDGRMPIGTFSAQRLNADLEARTVSLNGRARLRIDQNGLKGSQ
jgi:lipopolysaccharide export system protein LptC